MSTVLGLVFIFVNYRLTGAIGTDSSYPFITKENKIECSFKKRSMKNKTNILENSYAKTF
jgi:hypothetical protein